MLAGVPFTKHFVPREEEAAVQHGAARASQDQALDRRPPVPRGRPPSSQRRGLVSPEARSSGLVNTLNLQCPTRVCPVQGARLQGEQGLVTPSHVTRPHSQVCLSGDNWAKASGLSDTAEQHGRPQVLLDQGPRLSLALRQGLCGSTLWATATQHGSHCHTRPLKRTR